MYFRFLRCFSVPRSPFPSPMEQAVLPLNMGTQLGEQAKTPLEPSWLPIKATVDGAEQAGTPLKPCTSSWGTSGAWRADSREGTHTHGDGWRRGRRWWVLPIA